ncbi:hypothetical protein PG996_012730 [Apiospora saccharicola]|uniref:Chitin-binding type-4 domain-containing protein n=1 Tax=Apiospora saccharicola TaxID=335842 RepID=A0ABR1U3F6_9PEZI
MAWVLPAAAAPFGLPYCFLGDHHNHSCVPGRCFEGPNGQYFCNMGINMAQPQHIVCNNHQQACGAHGQSNINVFVAQPSNPNIIPANAAVVRWAADAWPTSGYSYARLDVPLFGRRPEDYYPYPPRLQALRDGSVPGLEYIPVLRDGWADYNSRTNHAVAHPVCDRCLIQTNLLAPKL